MPWQRALFTDRIPPDMIDKLKLDTDSTQPLRDNVYKTLRDAILKGDIEPGARLMEIHLSNSLGVSRTPVREAIRMLEQEGLAITSPRKGACVAHMTIKDLQDVIEIRKALDILAVKEACKKADSGIIKELEDTMYGFEKAVESGDAKLLAQTDEMFHSVIYKAADNPKLSEIVQSLREQMYRYRFEYVKEKNKLAILVEEHHKILEGIKNKDSSFVQQIMEEHLVNQYISIEEKIKNQETGK